MALVEATFLLYTLNEMLCWTAVMVQPLECGFCDGPRGGGDTHSAHAHTLAALAAAGCEDGLLVVDLPLPLEPPPDESTDLTLILTPGHVRGHLCLLCAPLKVLFSGEGACIQGRG